MAKPHDVFHWTVLSSLLSEIKTPNSFLKNLLFSNHETFPLEHVEMGLLTGDRETAPFVRKDGEAVMVDGYGEKFQTVSFPNIRIKRPMTASELMFKRRPGTVIFPSRGQQLNAIEMLVARDAQRMADLIANAEEWLCAMAIRGQISYQAPDGANFQITFPKPAGHTTSASTAWSDHANAEPSKDFLAAKRLIDAAHGLPTTHCIMSQEAAENFLQIKEVKELLDVRRIFAGGLDLTQSFQETGALFLGSYMGIQCWEYSRTVKMAGSSVPLIRDGYVEFVSATREASNHLWFGAIPDVDALEGRLYQGERFAKSWVEKDPSVRQMLVHSRPLPVMRRPGSTVSMDTTP